MSFFSFDIGLGEASISETYEIPEDKDPFRDRTQDFLDKITRPYPKSRQEGGVQPLVITLEGYPGTGKSQIIKSIMDVVRSGKQWKSEDGLVRGYKEGETQAIYCKAKRNISTEFHLRKMLEVVKDVPVCLFIIDDALNLDDLKELIAFYSDIRHRWAGQVCKVRGIIIPKGMEPLDFVDVGLPSCLILFQDRYDMATAIRRKANIEIRMQEPIHLHHANLARQAVGNEAVNISHINRSRVEKGHYDRIGHGVVLMALEDAKGLSSGKIYFPLKKNDKRVLSDFYDNVIDIEYEYLKSDEKASTKSPEKRKDFKVTDSETWSGLEDFITQKFWDHKNKEGVRLRELFNDPEATDDWGQNHPRKNLFLVKERIRMFIYRNYQGLEDNKIAKKCNKIRYESKITETLDTRSIENYRSKSFFKRVSLASNSLGVWLEEWVLIKLQYLVRELLEKPYSPTVPLTEEQRDLLKRTVFTRGVGSGASADLSLGDLFFFNVKNQLARRGDFEPTPEARLAQENQSSFGILNIKALKPGVAQLYMYLENRVGRGGDSVPSSVPFSKFKSVSGWLEVLLEILQVIAE